jgi:hypothetical protein
VLNLLDWKRDDRDLDEIFTTTSVMPVKDRCIPADAQVGAG